MKGMAAVKKELMALREELLKGIGENLKSARSAPERDVGDFYDDVDVEKDRQMSLMLNERERAKLNAIDEALEKIKDKSYGTCEECGEDINKKRLKIIPFARFCIKCQSEMERQAVFTQEAAEEKMIYKDVSINDIESSEE